MAGFYKTATYEPRVVPGFKPFRPDPKRYYVIDLGYETPCWYWNGDFNEGGYAIFNISRPRAVPVHRSYYQMLYGDVAPGKHLHHKCEQKCCVNPDHLEPVGPSAHSALHHTSRKVDNTR